ncbi:hypothetical protein GALLR39Z86_09820 [Glycomyces algeriensis]|uniref:Uncharacterized protein n=1 Tax=Glycomyces algeriensis TaxID=256037 RepID=A0A9W6G6B1_9ACTN|nr:hypothetical protein GALLR39Z86_09820 [Glycomyces algeriensis]
MGYMKLRGSRRLLDALRRGAPLTPAERAQTNPGPIAKLRIPILVRRLNTGKAGLRVSAPLSVEWDVDHHESIVRHAGAPGSRPATNATGEHPDRGGDPRTIAAP